jgi:F-box and leucine-rich repeat protein GRR1
MPGLLEGNSDVSSMSFQDDMITVSDRLPTPGEYRRVRHLDLARPVNGITEEDLAQVLQVCPHLETVVLGGIPRAVSDRILTILADTAIDLLGLDIYGCKAVTDAGLMACMSKSLPLQWVRVNGVVRLTDVAVEAVAKTCSRLVELELCDLPALTNTAVRDIWLFSRCAR